MSLLLAGCAHEAARRPPGQGVSRELAAFRKATLSAVGYDLRLSVPASGDEPVAGTIAVRFRRDDPEGRPVVLDFRSPAPRIRAVEVDGHPVEPGYEADHVVLPPEAFGGAGGEHEVVVAFEAGDEALNRTEDFLYALFVPDRAHFSLPVFDQPDLKARFALTLEVPPGWTATSNGAALDTIDVEAAGADATRTRFRFARTEPLPTYLLAFAAGRFRTGRAERAGRVLTFHHRETDSARVARNLEAIFDLHGTALEWLEAYTGIDYPFGEFGFVAVPSFQYGGMEHPGAVYYRADGLFLDESATQGDLLGRASVIAHETAHMWFGDLVTMEWFDDVWMKEVFANFMAAKIVHPSFPELDHDLRFLLDHFPPAYAVDRSAGANPIRQELDNLSEAGTLYGAIIYQKAPIVMRQLELMVGQDTFRDGLRDYLDAFRYGNATWPDLIEILDARTPRDLAAWSRVWVGEPDRPTVRAELEEFPEGRIGRLVLSQDDPRGRGRVWPQRLDVVLGYGPDSTVALPVELLEARTEVEDARGLPAPAWVLPGGRGAGYGRFALDRPTRARLLAELPEVDEALVRGVGWIALWDGVLEGEVQPEPFLDLALRGAGSEETDLILERILGYLETTWWRLLPAERRAARAAELEGALWRGVEAPGSRTRRASFLEAYRAVAVTGRGLERLRSLWAGERELEGLPLSERDRTRLAEALALREVEGWAGILDRQAQEIDNPDRKARFEFVRPSLSADPEVREAFFRSLEDPANRAREPWVVDGVSHLHHPLRADHARAFIEPSLELLEEIRRTGDIFFPARWLDATLGGHSSPEAADAVRAFLEAHPRYPPRLRAKILQSADLLFRASVETGAP